MPVDRGSTTHSTATAATAASTALPPAPQHIDGRRASPADWASPPCPSVAWTGERPGSWKSRIETDLEWSLGHGGVNAGPTIG